MNITTKYSFGDKPWKIAKTPKESWLICPFCGGTGAIAGKDSSSRSCPECHGRKGRYFFTNEDWRVTDQLTIGQIRVMIRAQDPVGTPGHEGFSNYGPQEAKYEEEYMCKETGIRSGSLHNVSTLWPTKEEAEAECKKRNDEETKEVV